MYFPEKFPDTNANYFNEVLRRTRLVLKAIRKGMDPKTRDLIKAIDNWQAALLSPKNFNEQDPDNYVKSLELSFEQLCTALEELGIANPRNLTVFQFYSKLTYFEEKRRKQEANKKAKA